jgi:23S rRNA (pseudouridine1915-N3)-methyltransferase
MKYRIISVGKIREHYIAAAVDDFRRRLRRYIPLDEIEIAPAHGDQPVLAMREEGERILERITSQDTVWLLERSGTVFSSMQLAKRLAQAEQQGIHRLTFIIAGTYGADPLLLARADTLWSLSALTFLHEWTRALLLEQLYRAAKITRNEPYHH